MTKTPRRRIWRRLYHRPGPGRTSVLETDEFGKETAWTRGSFQFSAGRRLNW